MIPLAAAEDVIDASGAGPQIEHMPAPGARSRQLAVRTLLAGMMITPGDGRPAHLTRVHQALTGLPEGEQRRLGVLAGWKNGPHLLTYRQAGYTFGLVARVPGKDEPDGQPLPELQRICDDLLESSVPAEFKNASASLAVDWSDLASFSRPSPRGSSDCADPEASWGHRRNNLRHDEDELFFGCYLSDAVMVPDEHGPPVPGFARRMTVSSCRHDPVPAFTPVLTAMPEDGIPLGDVLSDSGYSHRIPQNWASPLRTAGAALVQDLHPHDRGPKGTHHGAVVANGNLYCPCTPRPLLELAPLSRAAAPAQAAAHDAKTAEAARYKLGRLTSDGTDGCHRVQCPAAAGKIRCPLRPPSMNLDRDRPEILAPAAGPAGVLHPADHHHPARHPGQDRAETRLPVRRLAPLLHPPQRYRARLRHRERPRGQQHRPRLVPPHEPGTPHAVHRDPARRPQPADPHRLERPAGRKPAARRQGPAPEDPQAAPQDPRHDRSRRRAALTLAGTRPAPATTTNANQQQREHAQTQKKTREQQKGALSTPRTARPDRTTDPARNVSPKCETRPARNVKTSRWGARGSNPEPTD